MSFDTDPKDAAERILAYHAESDCYIECSTRAEYEHYCGGGEQLDEVTDVEHHEAEFKSRKDQDLLMSEKL